MEQEEQKRKKTQRQKQKQTHNQMQNRPRAPKRSLEELTLLDRFLFDEAMENPENMETLLKLAVDDKIRLKSVPQRKRKSAGPKYTAASGWTSGRRTSGEASMIRRCRGRIPATFRNAAGIIRR